MFQHVGVMEEQPERTDTRRNAANFDTGEFYTAVVNQDVGRILEMSRKYGSNSPIEIQGVEAGGVFCKVNTTVKTLKKNNN